MADDKKATIEIETKFDGKQLKTAKKQVEEVAKATEKAQGAIEENSAATSSFSLKAVAAWAAVSVAIKKAYNFAKESVQAYLANARAVNTLEASFKAVGYTSAEAMKQAKAFASEMQSLTGIADEAFLDAQRLLANYGVVGAKAQEAIRSAYALSVGVGMDFQTSLLQIAKAAAGSTSSLSRYGIVLGDGVKEGEKFDAVLAQINERFGAAAQASMDDTITKTRALAQEWGDFKEMLGKELEPTFRRVVDYAREFVSGLSALKNQNADQKKYAENLAKIADLEEQVAKSHGRYSDMWRAKRYEDINALKQENFELEKKFEKELKNTAEQKKQADNQAQQINNSRQLKTDADERAKKEAQVTAKLQEQLETFRQNAQQSSNERKVKFTADIAGSDLSGLASIDVRLEQEHALQEQLAQVREQALQEQLERARSAADAETQIGQERIAKSLEQLQEFNAEQAILGEEYLANRQALDQRIIESNQAVYDIQKILNSQQVQDFSKGLNAMAQMQNSKSKALVGIGKAAALAQVGIDTAEGAIAAYQAMAHIPFVGPALGIAAAAALTAYGAERAAEISGIKMAEGGLVKAVTGGVPAVVGEGGSDEAVLPLDNTRAMQRIGSAIGEAGGIGGGVIVNINVQASGGVEAILEQLTEASRSGVVQALEFANLNYQVGQQQQGLSV